MTKEEREIRREKVNELGSKTEEGRLAIETIKVREKTAKNFKRSLILNSIATGCWTAAGILYELRPNDTNMLNRIFHVVLVALGVVGVITNKKNLDHERQKIYDLEEEVLHPVVK